MKKEISYAPISADDDHDHHHHHHDRKAFDSFLIRILPKLSPMILIHSCNGLLLFTTSLSRLEGMESYSVFNPATSELVHIPDRPLPKYTTTCFLAFNPHKSPHYEVIRFFTVRRDHNPVIAVEFYSSLTGEWFDLTSPPLPHLPRLTWCNTTVLHNGALHILETDNEHILIFGVENVFVKVLPLPSECHFLTTCDACIGESKGRLYLAMNLGARSELKVWMLEEKKDGGQYHWHLKHTMSTAMFKLIFPIALHPDSEIIYLSVPSKILSYHITRGRYEEICRVTDTDSLSTCSACYWGECLPRLRVLRVYKYSWRRHICRR